MDRPSKEKVVGEIKDQFQDVISVIVADYRGVDVPTVTEMRDEFRAAGCHYRVLKNTLVKLAVKDTDLEPMGTLLSGPSAVIWSNESPSAPAKVAVKWAKEAKSFEIKGGFFGGEILDVAGVQTLSTMPDKPELQSKLLMTFIAAPTDFVRLMAAAPTQFAYLLKARENQLNEQ